MKRVVFFLFSLFFFCFSVYAEEFDITGKYVSLYNMNEDMLIYSWIKNKIKDSQKLSEYKNILKII